MADTTTAEVSKHGTRLVTISVNNKPVEVRGPRATGLQIKQAAVEQGVPIDLDFQLAKIRPNGEHRIVGDEDTVRVGHKSRFVATACDDNSQDN